MARWILVVVLAFVMAGCGGGDPEDDEPVPCPGPDVVGPPSPGCVPARG